MASDSETSSVSADPNERFYPEKAPDIRTDAERDRDRVLYSSQFARLAEITQVISPDRGYVFHNRLTHSLKVAQIARRIAQRISSEAKNDARVPPELPDVVEAAALAHDLGHPPFGHAAEEELNKLVQNAGLRDGFEGNAQSLRILTKLAASDALTLKQAGTEDEYEDSAPGLNWTRQCLDSVLKYPWGFQQNEKHKKKWGFYNSEKEIFDWVRKGEPNFKRSLGAEIIDWADDVTYAIHDLLDFFRSGNIPIDRLKVDRREYLEFVNGIFLDREPDWKASQKEYEEALGQLIENFPFYPARRFVDSTEDHRRLHQFATSLIKSFMGALTYVPSPRADEAFIMIDPVIRRQVNMLKQLTWHYIILNRELALPQAGQRKAIRAVFRKLLLAARKPKPDSHLFPASVQDSFKAVAFEKFFGSEGDSRVRVVADYVAGMTEKELMRIFRTMEGT